MELPRSFYTIEFVGFTKLTPLAPLHQHRNVAPMERTA